MKATLNNHRIELTPAIPSGWQDARINGSNLRAWQGDGVIVMTEQVMVNIFTITLIRVFLRSPKNLELSLQLKGINFSFCIEGSWRILNGDAETAIQKDQYMLFLSTDTVRLISTQIPGRMSQLLLIAGDSKSSPDATTIFTEPLMGSALMIDQVLQLTQTSYLPKPRSFHEKLIIDLINEAQTNAANKKKPTQKITNTELEGLYKVSVLIEKNLQQHYSIASLAVFSGMNRQKLTAGFKSLFGQTIYGYYFSKRMELAKNLLVYSHLPIKAVSRKAGYRNSTNFSIAFKKFYGITPGQMRREKCD